MQDKILLPYVPILVESTRSIGYSFEASLADIIDNSIGKDSRARHVGKTTIMYQMIDSLIGNKRKASVFLVNTSTVDTCSTGSIQK